MEDPVSTIGITVFVVLSVVVGIYNLRETHRLNLAAQQAEQAILEAGQVDYTRPEVRQEPPRHERGFKTYPLTFKSYCELCGTCEKADFAVWWRLDKEERIEALGTCK